MKDICFDRIATVLGQERLDLVRQFDWQLDYLELAYTRLGVGETRISDEEILKVYDKMPKIHSINYEGQVRTCLTLEDFPEIEGFIIVDDSMIERPMKWPEVPFVYQYFMHTNRPEPPGVETMMWQFGSDDIIIMRDGLSTGALWDKELLFYDEERMCVDCRSLVEWSMGWGNIIKRNDWNLTQP